MAHWVQSPDGEVQTLLLDPLPVIELTRGGIPTGTTLSMGAFYARWDSPMGPLDELALMVQLVGGNPEAVLGEDMELLFAIDGEVLAGRTGASDNSRQARITPRGREVTLALPIDPDRLEQMTEAGSVRIQVGVQEAFELPLGVRIRLGSLLTSIPEGNGLHWDRASATTVATSQ
jgi:hypothetical protein